MKLEIDRVGKCYKKGIWGVRDMDLNLGPGVVGLLGPNGAGKSTLMRILATISRVSEGWVRWNGVDIAHSPDELRRHLGYLPQDFGVYPNLNALEFLSYVAAAKGLDHGAASRRIDELLPMLNLTEVARRPLGTCSKGMKQRVGIAQALLNNPRLLIVDEPTVGLDPEERVRFRHLLAELSGERIVILSTHIVSDIEAIATDLAIINQGRLVIHEAPEELLRRVDGQVWEWVVASADLADIKLRHRISGTVRRGDGVHVRVVAREAPSGSALSVAPTLEDAYLRAIDSQPVGTEAAVA